MSADIIIVTDAFKGEKHKSKAYTKDHIVDIMNEVSKNINKNIDISYKVNEIGRYMYEIQIRRLK